MSFFESMKTFDFFSKIYEENGRSFFDQLEPALQHCGGKGINFSNRPGQKLSM
jgi:hypothetical protein